MLRRTTLRLGSRLYSLDTPLVMGIINVTPDSFYAGSRFGGEEALHARIQQLIAEGASIADVGAYSSRSGAAEVSPEEERQRLELVLSILRRDYPELPVSLDTFRADIARWAVEEHGVACINDISGGALDPAMYRTVTELQVAYILMHMRGTPQDMMQQTDYADVTLKVLDYFIQRVGELTALGLHDLILDPGFGFSKTLEQNFELLERLRELHRLLPQPLLVGVSRKSMIYRSLGIAPEEALNGTTVLNTLALERGASILRVHDVAAAVEAVCLWQQLQPYKRADGALHYYERRDPAIPHGAAEPR
nr:dihydropteroate synthase [uncultured Porphyromonas sp.]